MTDDTSKYDGLEPVDLAGTVTFDLYDHVDALLDERIPGIEEDIEEFERALDRGTHDEFAEADDGTLTAQEERQIRAALAELRQDRQRAEFNARLFHTSAEEWGGSAFVMKRNLGFHEVKAATDDIKSMSVRSGESLESATAKDGAYTLKVLQYGAVETPPSFPGFNADGVPWQVGEWLYAEFEAVNSDGGEPLGNSSSTPPTAEEGPQSE